MIPKAIWTQLRNFRPIGKPILLYKYTSGNESFFGPSFSKLRLSHHQKLTNKYTISKLVAFIILDLSGSTKLRRVETKTTNVKTMIDNAKEHGSLGFENGADFSVLSSSADEKIFKDDICMCAGYRSWNKKEKKIVNAIRDRHLPLEFDIDNISEKDRKRDYTGAYSYLKKYYAVKGILTIEEVLEKLEPKTYNRFDLMDFD